MLLIFCLDIINLIVWISTISYTFSCYTYLIEVKVILFHIKLDILKISYLLLNCFYFVSFGINYLGEAVIVKREKDWCWKRFVWWNKCWEKRKKKSISNYCVGHDQAKLTTTEEPFPSSLLFSVSKTCQTHWPEYSSNHNTLINANILFHILFILVVQIIKICEFYTILFNNVCDVKSIIFVH